MAAEERRERLVEAAIRVMTRDGVARATTRAIAAEAEMPLGLFHYAFRSKQELMVRVTETIAVHSESSIQAAMGGVQGDDLLEVVRAALSAYLDHVVTHPEEHLVTYELTTSALRDPETVGAARRQHEHYQRFNEALLEASAKQLGLEYAEPVPVIARYVFSLMDGLALSCLARGDIEQAQQVVDLTARTLVSMVRRPSEAG